MKKTSKKTSRPRPLRSARHGRDESEPKERVPVGLTFARHETFHPRFGWIKKGFEASQKNHLIFNQGDAPSILGVGKNMVRAIRYWSLAFKVLSEIGRTKSSTEWHATKFGQFLLGEEGADPFMEDPGSLWLLHWRLLQKPRWASAWHFTFSEFPRPEFTTEELVDSLRLWVAKEAPDSVVVAASLKKDVQCIIRMYAEAQDEHEVNEDSIDCPFVELGLIRPIASGKGQKRTYAFNVGPKTGLSSELVAAASLEFSAEQSGAAKTISFSRLLQSPGSPGMAFKLNEASLYKYLEDVVEAEPRLQLSDSAGVVQLAFTDDPRKIAQMLLKRHFKANASGRVLA